MIGSYDLFRWIRAGYDEHAVECEDNPAWAATAMRYTAPFDGSTETRSHP